jgi:hypothetical protein
MNTLLGCMPSYSTASSWTLSFICAGLRRKMLRWPKAQSLIITRILGAQTNLANDFGDRFNVQHAQYVYTRVSRLNFSNMRSHQSNLEDRNLLLFMADGGETLTQSVFTTTEIHNRWLKVVSGALLRDRLLTDKIMVHLH